MISLADRLARLSIPEPNTGCQLWLGTIDRYGYGGIWVAGKKEKAHRAAWKVATGRWPPSNLVLDHRCRVRACLNFDHLKPVKMTTNTLRGESFAGKKIRAKRTAHECTHTRARICTLSADDESAAHAAEIGAAMPRRPQLRHQCPRCKKEISSFVPKDGDGSGRYLRRHRCVNGSWANWIEAPGWEISVRRTP